jgi:integrase
MSSRSQSAGEVPVSIPGPQPLPLRDGSVTLARVIDSYMAAYRGRDPTRPQRLGIWRGRVGHLSLDDLDDDTVHRVLSELSERRAAYFAGKDVNGEPILRAKRGSLAGSTLNRIQAALSAALTWAQHQRVTPKGWQNPCRAIPMRKEPPGRVRYLTEGERQRFLAAAREDRWERLYLWCLLLLTSGCRRGEAEGLRWKDIDLERGEAIVGRSKNGDPKALVLVPAVVDEARKFVGAPDALVFPSKRKPKQVFNVTPAWHRALNRAGIKCFRIHDARHDAASSLAMAGASLLEIADVLGHRQLGVTKRYSHLATDHKRELVGRVMANVGVAAK